jgi:hypothetical protein
MKITGTFLDEISHDIPHQNWGMKEWDRDFGAMKIIGINTVILIRSGHRKWMTFPSEVLMREKGAYMPPIDLVGMFLKLSEKYGMDFFCGTYDSGNPHWRPEYDVKSEVALMHQVNQEIWEKYGHSKSFKGWYLSAEIAGKNPAMSACYKQLGKDLKSRREGLQIMISPGMLGPKAYDENMNKLNRTISPEQHESEWNEILSDIQGVVDIVAFQDGHLEIDDLPTFLAINKKLCDRYGIKCWTNTESFDRDMPIDFLPIKWEKLLLKLNMAEKAGLENAITFEFSHFMSPNSCYLQAGNLYRRYAEHFGININDCISTPKAK